MEIGRSPKQFLKQFGPNCRPGSAKGLYGRIIKGKRADDFIRLSGDSGRKLVSVMGAEGLEEIAKLSGCEALLSLGLKESYIKRLLSEGASFKLAVFKKPEVAIRADWDGTVDLVCQMYPKIADRLLAARQKLKIFDFHEIEQASGFTFAEIDKDPRHPMFITEEKLLAIHRRDVIDVRAFLYFVLRLNESFSGDGWTHDADGDRFVPEYLVPNYRLDKLSNCRTIDLPVKV